MWSVQVLRKFIMCSTLFAVICGTLAFGKDDTFHVVNIQAGETLNIRMRPDINAPAVGKISAESKGIVRIGECKEWCKVRFKEKDGWVKRSFLALETSGPPVARGTRPVPVEAPAVHQQAQAIPSRS